MGEEENETFKNKNEDLDMVRRKRVSFKTRYGRVSFSAVVKKKKRR